MVDGLHLYSPFIQSALQYCLTFTHSYTDGGANHARQQPTRQEQLGLGVLLIKSSSCLLLLTFYRNKVVLSNHAVGLSLCSQHCTCMCLKIRENAIHVNPRVNYLQDYLKEENTKVLCSHDLSLLRSRVHLVQAPH